MAVHFHESEIEAEPLGPGLQRQRLLTPERVTGTRVLLDRIAMQAGARLDLHVADDALAWFQLIEGSARLVGGGVDEALAERHVTFLPPGFDGRLEAEDAAVLVLAEVPNAPELDPGFAGSPPALRVVDWHREPVLASEHDARSRIYLATPKLFGTHAIKGEMIIYPPNTAGADHHHVGADHFMVFLKGTGTTYAGGKPIRVRGGDVVYYPDLERHWLQADPDGEMVFVEFFVPGTFETVWAEEAKVCTWNPTGRDITGGKPIRDIARHHHGAPVEV
jgi:quercetin dioxygenase-like cupin family protein